MDPQEEKLNQFMKEFKEEIVGISDINTLKDLFASEIARRDIIIEELKNQNEVLLKSAFKQKKENLNFKKD